MQVESWMGVARLRRWAARSSVQRAVCLAVLIAVVALFVLPIPLPFDGRLIKALETAAHYPLFLGGVLAWCFLFRPAPTWPALRLSLAGVTVVAIVLELVQALAHRDPNLEDTFFSALGGWSALLVWYSLHTTRRWFSLGAWCLCLLLGLLTCLPPALILADRAYAYAAFPLLASFEGRSEVGRWWGHECRLTRVNAQYTHGRYALRVALDKPRSAYPGLFMTDGRLDWRGYNRLCMDIYLTGGSECTLWLRADDQRRNPDYHDRAQTMINLTPGANSICLELDSFLRTPSGRALDRSHLTRWGLFFDAPRGGESIFLDQIRLAR